MCLLYFVFNGLAHLATDVRYILTFEQTNHFAIESVCVLVGITMLIESFVDRMVALVAVPGGAPVAEE
jgi:succinate dehydrogenase/fumarate reductase cytochrome b subunit